MLYNGLFFLAFCRLFAENFNRKSRNSIQTICGRFFLALFSENSNNYYYDGEVSAYYASNFFRVIEDAKQLKTLNELDGFNE